METIRFFFFAGLVTLFSLPAGSQCNETTGSNLIINGGFEMPIVSPAQLYSAPTGFTGWNVTTGEVDLINQDIEGSFAGDWSNGGQQSVDMNGTVAGAISQTINTIEGEVYQLSFYLSSNDYCNDPPAGHPIALIVIVNGIVQDIYDAPANGSWTPYQTSFIGGPGGQSTVEFISNNLYQNLDLTQTGCGALLDDVEVYLCSEPGVEIPPLCKGLHPGEYVGNGSFESEDVSDTDSELVMTGENTISGWSVEGEVDIINQSIEGSFAGDWANSGSQGIDLNGEDDSGKITQMVNTFTDGLYELSFFLSSNIYCTFPRHGIPDGLIVEIDGQVVGQYSCPTNPIWLQHRIRFEVSDQEFTEISFSSTIDGLGCGPLIDDVSVSYCSLAEQNLIPTLGQWGLIIMTILLLTLGTVGLNQYIMRRSN